MGSRIRRPLHAEERAELWARWRGGETVAQIARELGRWQWHVRGVLEKRGGISPAARRRAARALTLAHREEISRGICAGRGAAQIAVTIGKATSTVAREIKRNGGREAYRAVAADRAAWERACRPKGCVLQRNRRLCARVAQGLKQQWSPEQIARRLVEDFPNDHSMRVSHETIYRTLFVQTRGALKKELLQHLRSGRKLRHSRKASTKGQGRGQIVDAVSIRERPAAVEERAVPGHWEGDLISGKNNSHIATLVERQSRYVLLAKVPSKETAPVIKALSRKI
jgi:IS30 family transposase